MSATPSAGAARQHFASDNYAGVCPEALRWFIAANALRELFQTDCDVYFVFNGTAANSLALASLCQSYHSVICSPVAHIETDECGGPEFFSNGSKLLLAEGDSPAARVGKLTSAAITQLVTKRSDIHYPKPKVVSLTQATELGTVYGIDEIRALSATAREHRLKVHMDGARFANAVAALGVHPAELTWRAGVDVLCFGGTKNGLPVGDAVLFFDRTLSEDFAWRVKQAGQLASKMRFISAPWLGMLEHDTWLRNAAHANAMARRLQEQLQGAPGVQLLHPAEVNSVFARLPRAAVDALRAAGWRFYEFIAGGGCRFMCSWDTTAAGVDAFAAAVRGAAAAAAR